MTYVTQDDTQSSSSLTTWKMPPTLVNLKRDLQDAKSSHDTQVSQITTWLDNIYVKNKAQIDAPKGNSKIVPKLIRKQAEWRYPH